MSIETACVFEKFIKAVKSHRLLDPGDTVIVAVSGGADSVALLHLLLGIRKQWALDLIVAHLNHSLRGQESNDDELFVRELAARHQMEFICEKVSDVEISTRRGNLENWARNRRYDFLHRCAAKCRAERIGLGHTRSDQAETLLMRLIRGSGTAGLSAMPPKRGKLIRPLMYLQRPEIQGYLNTRVISWREDASNQNTALLRNRLRHELIPYLKEAYNPKIVRTLSKCAQILGEDAEALRYCVAMLFDQMADFDGRKVVWNVGHLLPHPIGLQKNLVRYSIMRLAAEGACPNSSEIASVIDLLQKGKSGKSFRTRTFRCLRSNQTLAFEPTGRDVKN
jgi:tRNA(Ile)-lysidine synthase